MGVTRERREDGGVDESRPALHLVTDSAAGAPDSADEGEGSARDAREARSDRTGRDQRAAAERSGLEEARQTLAEVDPVQYHKVLSGLVRQGHDSVLGPLPYTPSLEFHDPTCVVVEPRPSGLETIELYARAAYPDFDEVLVEAFTDPLVARQLTDLYHLMWGEGANVALVTNHGQIIDIALVIGALLTAMCDPDRTYGVLGDRLEVDQVASRVNVMVSRMVTTRQAFNVPAIQVLQCGGRTFLSVPQTHSRRRVRLEPAVVRANNLVVRHELDHRLAEGGQLLGMAASGSQDLSIAAGLMQKVRTQWRQRRGVDPGDTDTLHLQPLYDGTMQLMLSCRYVMPVAVSLSAEHPALVIGDLTRVREKDDCHRIMDWIADAHEGATGVTTIYHRHEDDLLTQVRSLVKF